MDIHRCRFVPYPPSGINALAFSHQGSATAKGRGPATLRLAVGRGNGDIEIWNPNQGTWFQETILRGGKERSIEGLAWTQDVGDIEPESGLEKAGKLRLFSIGYSTTVTEWDLEKGQPAQHSGGNYGEIWCLAAQPKWQPQRDRATNKPLPPTEGEYRGQHLAAGCADGAIIIFSTEDGELKYLRTMRPSTKKARVLSITFQDRNTVIAGYADSTIRVFDVRNGQLLRNMSLGKSPSGGPKNILVWSVKCLPDGTIVSGDSTGQLRFWDAKNYSMSQQIQSHVADILDVATSPDGESVVSGGADRRTTVYKKTGNKGDKQRRWVELMHRRYHSNDVKSLAVFETREISIVVSGGPDTMPVLVPLRNFGKENHRTLSSLPHTPQISSSPNSRYVMSWWDREVSICWVSNGKASHSEGPKFKLVSKVFVKGDENITSAVLSQSGDLLIVATVASVKVFRLSQHKRAGHPGLRVQQIETPSSLSTRGASLVALSPNECWVCIVRPDSGVCVTKLFPGSDEDSLPEVSSRLFKLVRNSRPEATRTAQYGTLGSYERTIRSAVFSSGSDILAVSDVSGHIDTWVLEGNEDSSLPSAVNTSDSDSDSDSDEPQSKLVQGQIWIQNPANSKLPRLSSPILFLSFRPDTTTSSTNASITLHPTRNTPNPHSHTLPTGEDRLIALTVDHKFYEFSVMSGSLSAWSKRNPASSFPSQFFGIKERAMGCVWDISAQHERIWLYGVSWLYMFDLSRDFPPLENTGLQLGVHDVFRQTPDSMKRKRAEEEQGTLKITNSGAGDAADLSKSYIGMGSKMRRIAGPNSSRAEEVSIEQRLPTSDSDEDDEEENGNTYDNDVALSQLRRTDAIATATPKKDGKTLTNGTANKQMNGTAGPPHWWHTHRYRDILGIVPLAQSSPDDQNGSTALVRRNEEEGDAEGLLEVALIERPVWDVDLPPSYYGDQEW